MLIFLKKLSIGIFKVFISLIVISLVYAAYGIYADKSASEKTNAICSSILPGSDPTSLRDRAIADGASDFLTKWGKEDGLDILSISYIGAPPFSRFICRVKAKDSKVISVKQDHLD